MGCRCANHDPGRFFFPRHIRLQRLVGTDGVPYQAGTLAQLVRHCDFTKYNVRSKDVAMLFCCPTFGRRRRVCIQRRLDQLVNRRAGISRVSLHRIAALQLSMNERNEQKANSEVESHRVPDQGVQPLGPWSNPFPWLMGQSLSTWD